MPHPLNLAGETIRIDTPARKLDLVVSPRITEERKAKRCLPEGTRLEKGSLLERYRRLVGSAMQGSVLE